MIRRILLTLHLVRPTCAEAYARFVLNTEANHVY
jgi:hypothetical protein